MRHGIGDAGIKVGSFGEGLKIVCSLSGWASMYRWMMTDDMPLVRDYAASQPERAFEQLVAWHLNLLCFARDGEKGVELV